MKINILQKIVNIFFIVVFSMILITIFRALLSWSIYMIGILPVIVLLIYFYLRKKRRFLYDRFYRNLWYILSGCSLILLFYVSFSCRVELSWDWGKILISASDFVLNGKMEQVEYYARYTNNQFFLICVTWLFQFIKYIYHQADFETFQNVSIVISILFVWAAIQMIYCITKTIWGVRRAVSAGIFSIGCLPLFMYAQFLYTDTPGIFFVTLLLYMVIRIFREETFGKRVIGTVLFGLIAGITYHIKVIPFIIFIAFIVAEILQKQKVKEKIVILFLALFCCVGTQYLLGNISDRIVSEKFGITAELKDNWEYPLTHWVMMGLNVENDGGYYENDVVYTASFHSLEERKKENRKVIKERMEHFGVAGYLKHVFCNKLPRTWGNSCFAGDDYIGRMPEHEEHVLVQFMKLDGKYHGYCLIYTWTYYVILFTGILLSGIMAVKNNGRDDILTGRIALLGLVFFQILWECNSRYLVTFIPMLIIVALDGYYRCKDRSAAHKS